MKRKLSRPLPDLSSIIALTGSDEDLDNVRRHKRYLSEVGSLAHLVLVLGFPAVSQVLLPRQAMANDMKRLTMSMDAARSVQHTPTSSARSDTEEPASGLNTPMDCCTPISDGSQLPSYPCPSPPPGARRCTTLARFLLYRLCPQRTVLLTEEDCLLCRRIGHI